MSRQPPVAVLGHVLWCYRAGALASPHTSHNGSLHEGSVGRCPAVNLPTAVASQVARPRLLCHRLLTHRSSWLLLRLAAVPASVGPEAGPRAGALPSQLWQLAQAAMPALLQGPGRRPESHGWAALPDPLASASRLQRLHHSGPSLYLRTSDVHSIVTTYHRQPHPTHAPVSKAGRLRWNEIGPAVATRIQLTHISN